MATIDTMRFVLLLLLCIGFPHAVDGGKVKDAIFNMFGSGKKGEHHRTPPESKKFDEDQAELIEWLKSIGFHKFATDEWLEKFDEDLAYDSIEDMTHLVADGDHVELGIEKEEAVKIQEAARKHLMTQFLQTVPLPEGASKDVFTKLLEPLIAAGYDEPDDVADIEMDEAEGLGIEQAHYKTLVTYAEEYETRELLQLILVTFEPIGMLKGAENPFAKPEVYKPLIEVMVKFGVRNLSDVSNLYPMEGLSKEHLALLKADPRVSAHATKQEL